jgi:hypothetical protein
MLNLSVREIVAVVIERPQTVARAKIIVLNNWLFNETAENVIPANTSASLITAS